MSNVFEFPSSRFTQQTIALLYRRAEEVCLTPVLHSGDSGDAMSFIDDDDEDPKWGIGRYPKNGQYALIDRRGREVILTADLGAVIALIQ